MKFQVWLLVTTSPVRLDTFIYLLQPRDSSKVLSTLFASKLLWRFLFVCFVLFFFLPFSMLRIYKTYSHGITKGFLPLSLGDEGRECMASLILLAAIDFFFSLASFHACELSSQIVCYAMYFLEFGVLCCPLFICCILLPHFGNFSPLTPVCQCFFHLVCCFGAEHHPALPCSREFSYIVTQPDTVLWQVVLFFLPFSFFNQLVLQIFTLEDRN